MQPSNSSPNESVSQISSNESVKKLASSKIPKLNKLHVFKKSLNRNFNSMKKLSKIPIRLIINKPIEQQQKQIRYEQNIQKKTKIQNKKVLTTKQNKSNKPNSNIKFKKIIKPCNNLQQKKQVNKKHIIRSETFDKKKESIKVLIETNDETTQIEINNDEISNSQETSECLDNFIKKPKRYCFPTNKSLSVYYNDRLNKKHNFQISSTNNINSYMPVKYLSDSDVSSLADRLSTYDKDIFYNVFHLDTLYTNIDYILFNSYASDTELIYSNSVKTSPEKDKNSSSYKLFVNDYFSHKYKDYDDDNDNDNNHIDELENNKEKSSININDVLNQITFKQSLNDFNLDIDPDNIFKSYEIENSLPDEQDNDDDNDYYIDRFNIDECVDKYYLNDDLLFDDEVLKISILNDSVIDINKQITIEMNNNNNNSNNLFLDYINSPTYSLSSLTSHSDSNYSPQKSITDSTSIFSFPVHYKRVS